MTSRSYSFVAVLVSIFALQITPAHADSDAKRPNILLAISDDQSFKHTSIESGTFVRTPSLEKIARNGFYFENGYAASPGCSPSRAALLTGRHHWMIGPAGTHGSSFPVHYDTFVDLLEDSGYKVGFTGKGWGPGDWLGGGRGRNPAGDEYNEIELGKDRKKGILNNDYAANFEQFLGDRSGDEPFFFWYGAKEPHLAYAEVDHGEAARQKVEVPGFLPDTVVTRNTLLDYADEIAHFDNHLGKILAILEAAGELDNTLVIITSDNGMPLPRAKATGYDYGIHVPLVIGWGASDNQGVSVSEPVGFVDLSATIMEAAGLDVPREFVGESLLSFLNGERKGLDPGRAVYAGRERHSSSRYRNLTYPQRVMRRGDFLVIWSVKPDRDPAGQHQEIINGELGAPHNAYYDIGPSLIKKELLANRDDPYFTPFFELAVNKQPEWQLFNAKEDPDCLTDLASSPAYSQLLADYKKQLLDVLRHTGDPRLNGYGHVWEDYPRTPGKMRYFPNPASGDSEE